MLSERLRYRLGLRSSNAARPHKNKHRIRKAGGDMTEAATEAEQGLMDYEELWEVWE